MAGILNRVTAIAPELFTAVDANGDRVIAFDELCVVCVENFSITETVRVHVAGVGPLTPFCQIAHELTHQGQHVVA
ncbi:hypothetical protein [Edaphobacter aggregans]|uniref:hypothetical protein n=1 Tax=Edaphobacter aggregans TaxID=570835 RepID=UPI0012FBAF58|nr:hypothetical protein [Edaphobacter aggregans]